MKFSRPELDEIFMSFAYEGYTGFITGIYEMILEHQNTFQPTDRCIILGNLSFLYYYSYDDDQNNIIYMRNYYIALWDTIIKITDTWGHDWHKAIPNSEGYYPDPIIYFGNDKSLELYGQIVK